MVFMQDLRELRNELVANIDASMLKQQMKRDAAKRVNVKAAKGGDKHEDAGLKELESDDAAAEICAPLHQAQKNPILPRFLGQSPSICHISTVLTCRSVQDYPVILPLPSPLPDMLAYMSIAPHNP